jgi:hypothetical protein
MNPDLIALCQQHLTQAWLDRIQHTERAVGNQFGFEIRQRETTTVLLAHHWPQADANVPFHRVFNYQALPQTTHDPLLEYLREIQIDAVIEVLPGEHQTHTEQVLNCYGFQPAWSISWLYRPLEQLTLNWPAE